MSENRIHVLLRGCSIGSLVISLLLVHGRMSFRLVRLVARGGVERPSEGAFDFPKGVPKFFVGGLVQNYAVHDVIWTYTEIPLNSPKRVRWNIEMVICPMYSRGSNSVNFLASQ